MPGDTDGYLDGDEVLDDLARYEARCALPLERPVRTAAVWRDSKRLRVEAEDGRVWRARAVVSATGIWRRPHIPEYPGPERFTGAQFHSAV